jgi:hypothetical protein
MFMQRQEPAIELSFPDGTVARVETLGTQLIRHSVLEEFSLE